MGLLFIRASYSAHEPLLKKIYCLFTALIISCIAHSQLTVFLPLTKLETKDGLSSPNVRKIARDKYGFMWFATQDGLNRYDGARFIKYFSASPDLRHMILESDVYDLAIEENGDYLWCLTAYGGLSKIDLITGNVTDTFRLPVNPSTHDKLWFKCMSIKKRAIYIGTDEGFAVKFNTSINRTEHIIKADHDLKTKQHIDNIYADDYGKTWMFISEEGINITDTTLDKTINHIDGKNLGIAYKPDFVFKGFDRLKDQLLIGTTGGLVYIDIRNTSIMAAEKSTYNIPALITKDSLQSINVLEDRVLISAAKGLYLLDLQTNDTRRILISKNYDDNSWITPTNCVFLAEKTIWVGCQYGVGWIRNIRSPFTGYYTSSDGSGVKIEHSTTLCTLTDTTLLVCATDDLYSANLKTGSIRKFGIPDFYFTGFKAPGDYIIASGGKDLYLIDKKGKRAQFKNIFPELIPIQKDLFISTAMLDDSLCFLASQKQNGIFVWNYKQGTLRPLNMPLRSTVINRLYIDSKKNLWIICDNAESVYNHYTHSIEHLDLINPKNAQALNINMDICEAGGKYWMASYGTGIIQLSQDRKIEHVYSASDNISSLGFYKIFRVNDSTIIASSNNGITTINIRSGRVINFFEEDGIQSNNFEETSGCFNDKFIFMGGMKGFTMIDKGILAAPNKEFSALYYLNIKISQPGRSYEISNLFIKKIKIPANAIQTEIDFSSPNYTIPGKIIFQYRMEGSKWASLGMKRFLSLIGTPPGTYNLQIRSSEGDGNWSKPTELTLVFLPKWYQTIWLKLGIALVIIGIPFAYHRIKINQIRKEQATRKKLGADLHDDIGSTLNGTKTFIELGMVAPEEIDHLVKAKSSVLAALATIRDMMWVLDDDKKDSVEDLATRLDKFAAPLCEANKITFKKDISSPGFKMTKDEKKNIYLILKEAVNNSVKYSRCGQINLSIKETNGKLWIEIKDNGIGFEVKDLPRDHRGLKNMELRAGEIKYELQLKSSIDKGTSISLKKIN